MMAQRDFEHAKEAAANLVASVASEIDRNIELYDLSLQAVVDGLNMPGVEQLNPSLRRAVLFDRAATAKDLGSILVLDPNGNVRLDSRTSSPRSANYIDRDFFRIHKNNPSQGLFVSAPWVTPEGEYLVSLSRRIPTLDGAFGGVVVGSMRLSYFHNLFRKLQFGPNDAMTLFDADGRILMRAPFQIDRIGQSIRDAHVFRHVPQNRTGFYTNRSIVDEIDRLYVYQQIGDRQLIVSEGLALDDVYADWRNQLRFLGSGMIVLVVFAILLLAYLIVALKRRAIAEGALALLASTDGLTQLGNRRLFDKTLVSEWRRAARSGTSISLLMIDVDHFKAYNDTHGHQAGDAALTIVGRCIAESTRRTSDLGARYGGEEFSVLLPGMDAAEAIEIARRIRQRMELARGVNPTLPTISIGVASVISHDPSAEAGLVRTADAALYSAKRSGRDQICVALSNRALMLQKSAA